MFVITMSDIIGIVCLAIGIVGFAVLFIVAKVSELGAKLGRKHNNMNKDGDTK